MSFFFLLGLMDGNLLNTVFRQPTRRAGRTRGCAGRGSIFSDAFDAESVSAVAVAAVEQIVQLAVLHGAALARLHRHHYLFEVSRGEWEWEKDVYG